MQGMRLGDAHLPPALVPFRTGLFVGTVVALELEFHIIGIVEIGGAARAGRPGRSGSMSTGARPPGRSGRDFRELHPSAAADGDGIAIGWNGFLTDYSEAGRLAAVRDEWLRTGLSMYGVPTPNGKRNQASKDCLRELDRLIGELCSRRPVTK